VPLHVGLAGEDEKLLVNASCYDATGPVRAGCWFRHEARASFTYDMGGRVGPGSPLYHEVTPEPDREFARIIEFDRGPFRS